MISEDKIQGSQGWLFPTKIGYAEFYCKLMKFLTEEGEMRVQVGPGSCSW